VGTAMLRYVYVQSEWQRQIEAKTQAQLKSLQARIRPHFLFNTLNSISALVKTDRSDQARKMISQLSHFLRVSLESEGLVNVSLAEEIKTLKLYLEIEKVRYTDRLRTEFDVDDAILDAQIPALILQPLFENALQYTIAGQVKGGCVRLRGQLIDGRVELSVADSGKARAGQDVDFTKIKKGVGLKNIEGRIKTHYGENGHVHYGASDLGGLEVKLSFPYKSLPEPK